MRLFIAALLPDEIKARLGGYIASLGRNCEGVKWEKEEKLHITLKFLGEVNGDGVRTVSSLTGAASRQYAPFEMRTGNLGGFPDLENPRILFVGMSENPGLSGLQREIENGLWPLGFERERRRFVPHVTIGRVKGRMRIKGPLPVPEKIPFVITEICIMKSEPGRDGSIYTPISIFPLGG